jgi:hypothetical protein
MAKLTCPKGCKGKRFTTLFKVVERHTVDENGDTLDYEQADEDRTEGPLDGAYWCDECQTQAVVNPPITPEPPPIVRHDIQGVLDGIEEAMNEGDIEEIVRVLNLVRERYKLGG